MTPLRPIGLVAATAGAAALGAVAFRAFDLPLALILGGMAGAALAVNLLGSPPGGRNLRRAGQMVVGLSVGAVLTPDVVGALVELLPTMLLVALLANVAGALLAFPVAFVAGIDRVTALLSCLPAGMAEIATLARELRADEASVTIIHTLRVVMVVTLIPLWLSLAEQSPRPPAMPQHVAAAEPVALLSTLAVSVAIAAAATRVGVINAYVMAPMLLGLCLAAFGIAVPAVPATVLAVAQVAIGASLGLRLRLRRMRRLPRVALGGLMSGSALFALAFFGFGPVVERFTGLSHLSAVLASAPGGLGEMIASAAALGLLVAPVAGFQLARTVLTNLAVAPGVRWVITRFRDRP